LLWSYVLSLCTYLLTYLLGLANYRNYTSQYVKETLRLIWMGLLWSYGLFP